MDQIESNSVAQSTPIVDTAILVADNTRTMAAGRYPKRTRTQINYSELDRDDSESDCEDNEDERPPPWKRFKVFRSSKPRPKHNIFPFMNLPAEIRNKIYHECLVSDQVDDQGVPSFYFLASRRRCRHTVTRCTRAEAFLSSSSYRRFGYRQHGYHIKWNTGKDASQSNDGIKSLVTNVLATCKAIYAEAAPLLFQQRFIFCDNMALLNFISECTPQAAALVRHIQVLEWLQTRSRKNVGYLAISLLAAKGFVHLQSLVVTGSLGDFIHRPWRQVDRTMEIHDRVAKKVYADFYPWLEMVGRAKGNMYEGLSVLDIGDATWLCSSASSKLKDEEEARSLKGAYEKSLKKLIRQNWL